jgi:hypothetical protein
VTITIRSTTLAEDAQLLGPLGVAFGFDASPARLERLQSVPELTMRLGAFD